MKHKIETAADGAVTIDVAVAEISKAKLMDGLKHCQSGQCGCPTDEYDKLAAIKVAENDDGVHIHLTAKSDTTIDTDEVEKCLSWMKDQAEKS